jgi:hypothetical protein
MGTSEFGGARRDRTADLLHAMQALSQLSYSPDKQAAHLRGEVPVRQPLKNKKAARFPSPLLSQKNSDYQLTLRVGNTVRAVDHRDTRTTTNGVARVHIS